MIFSSFGSYDAPGRPRRHEPVASFLAGARSANDGLRRKGPALAHAVPASGREDYEAPETRLVSLHQAGKQSRRDARRMEITFPGGARVDAFHAGCWIHTDQPASAGGGGSAPSPFDLFLASIGTCAGFYALRFCQMRGLDTDGLALSLTADRDQTGKRVERVRIAVTLPHLFPEKYRKAIVRAVDECAVKRTLTEPPRFEIRTVAGHAALTKLEESIESLAPTAPPRGPAAFHGRPHA
jgi:ribosomal protein S12 methylthiotransferase accessory factor